MMSVLLSPENCSSCSYLDSEISQSWFLWRFSLKWSTSMAFSRLFQLFRWLFVSLLEDKPLLVGGFNQPLWKIMDFVSWNYDYSQLNGQIYRMFKNMKVSWDDDIPNIWKNIIHVPNHQPWLSIETWLWAWFSINTWGYLVFSGKWMTILVWEFFNNHGDNWWSSKELSYLSWLQLNPEMMMQTWGYPLVN